MKCDPSPEAAVAGRKWCGVVLLVDGRRNRRVHPIVREPRMFVAAVSEASQAVTETRYIGHSVKRIEDRPLLTGTGRFVDDLRFADMLEAAFVRSPHAHAAIRGIDTEAAGGIPACTRCSRSPISAVAREERLPLQFRTAQLPPDITPLVLAKDEVAFVGEAVAVVIAPTRYIAEDAAALVAVDYEPLPAVSTADGRWRRTPRCPSRPRRQSPDRVPAILRRRRERLRARTAPRQRQPQAAPRRRAFDRGPRRARRLRRQRGPADAVVVDAARARGARLPDELLGSTKISCAWWRPTSAAASAPSSSCIRKR